MGNSTDEAGNIIGGDHILVNKTSYWAHKPQRGDIVVFSTDDILNPYVRKSTFYIKRIVGLPGETVSINPPDLIINGSPITDPEIFQIISSGKDGYHGFTLASSGNVAEDVLSNPEDTITLGTDEYFVLGDNSINSLDSRYFGPIRGKSIIGKVFYIYSPVDRKQWIK